MTGGIDANLLLVRQNFSNHNQFLQASELKEK